MHKCTWRLPKGAGFLDFQLEAKVDRDRDRVTVGYLWCTRAMQLPCIMRDVRQRGLLRDTSMIMLVYRQNVVHFSI